MTASAILTYHSIDSSGSVISIAPEVFRRHMETLAEAGISVVPLSRVQGTTGSVAITFDDGFANFEDEALPVLKRYRFPATVFLVSGHCGGLNDWAGQGAAAPRLPLMSWPAVQSLSGELVEWGAHTVSHPDLAALSEDALSEEKIRGEISESRAEIEDRTGIGVKAFAYPYGSVNAFVRAAAAREFDLACGTRLRYLSTQADPLELPRIDAYYLRNPARMKSLLQPGGRLYMLVRRILREGRTWVSQ